MFVDSMTRSSVHDLEPERVGRAAGAVCWARSSGDATHVGDVAVADRRRRPARPSAGRGRRGGSRAAGRRGCRSGCAPHRAAAGGRWSSLGHRVPARAIGYGGGRARRQRAGRATIRSRAASSWAARQEPHLERARRQVDALVEHRVEERGVTGRRRCRDGVGEVADRSVTPSSVKKTLNMLPRCCTTWGTPAVGQRLGRGLADRRARPCRGGRRPRRWPAAAWSARRSWRPGSPTACRPGRPARPARACAITSARPPNAAAGKPPPITLPNVIRSGRQPSTAPSRPQCPERVTRKPVITSSLTNSAPCVAQVSAGTG